MKKIFFAIMAVAALSFTACDNAPKANVEEANADSIVIEEPSVNVDETISALSAAVESSNAEEAQSILEKAKAYIAQLQEEGKIEEAKVYIAKIQEFIAANEEKITALTNGNETISNLVSAVKAIPTDVADAATEAAEGVKDAAADAASDAKEAVNDAANAAVDKGKEEAGKAIDNAASTVKGKLGI